MPAVLLSPLLVGSAARPVAAALANALGPGGYHMWEGTVVELAYWHNRIDRSERIHLDLIMSPDEEVSAGAQEDKPLGLANNATGCPQRLADGRPMTGPFALLAPPEPTMDIRALAVEERLELAAFLETLSPEQWEEPSLCTGWRVRDVVTHLVSYEELRPAALLARAVSGGFQLSWMNALGVAEQRSPEELVAQLRRCDRPRGLTTTFGSRVALLDAVVHHQDIRRPLGMDRTVPADRLLAALRFALVAPPVGAFWRSRGLRLVATDLEWATGSGPEIRGPGEALLLAITGRRPAVDELTGPGQPKLAERVNR